jgi:hypothetical protein
MRTFADETDRSAYKARIVTMPSSGVECFRCRCGRVVPFDMMLDVSAAGGVPRGGDRYRCDGCWRRWQIEGHTDPDKFRADTEQPPRGKGSTW